MKTLKNIVEFHNGLPIPIKLQCYPSQSNYMFAFPKKTMLTLDTILKYNEVEEFVVVNVNYTVNSKGSFRVFLGYFFDKKTLMKGTLIKKGSFTTKKPKLRFFVEKKTKRKVFCRQKYLIKGYFP